MVLTTNENSILTKLIHNLSQCFLDNDGFKLASFVDAKIDQQLSLPQMRRQQNVQPQIIAQKMHRRLLPYHIIYRDYLRPLEVLLRTHKADPHCARARLTSLPQGLLIASKESINRDAYFRIPMDAREARGERYPQQSKEHRRNLLNLLKEVNSQVQPQNPDGGGQSQINPQTIANNQVYDLQARLEGFELAICVCVYSEDVKMLRQTLDGIKENLIDLVKSGVRQDAIGVFVFFDGIERIDKTMLEYFERMENQSIYVNSFGSSSSPWSEYQRVQRGRQVELEEQEEQKFFNQSILRILFSQTELNDREERTFKRVYQNYMGIVALKKDVLRLKNEKKIQYDHLPVKVQEQFIKMGVEKYKKHLLYKKEGRIGQDEQRSDSSDQLFVLFEILDKNPEEKANLCIKALIETEIFCDKFLSARSDLAYLFMHQELIYSKTVEELASDEMKRIHGDEGRPYFEVIMPPSPGEELAQLLSQEPCQIHLNLFFTIKYKNQGKLSSHNWFLNGFCKELKPNFMILMDVGLKPKEKAIFTMYHHLKANPKVGGVCGYMSLRIERTEQEEEIQAEQVDCLTNIAHKFVDIQRAQQIQYHFAHLLDKPFESLFDFIHVLPGAFSGYSMRAIHNPADEEETILRKYFESLSDKLTENHIVETEMTLLWMAAKVLLPDFAASCFLTANPNSEEQMLCNENMNLAEDRILCFGIHKNGFDLAFLPDAYSEVDPIKNLHSLLGQRKRWINGSFFAFQKVKQQLSAFEKSRKTFQVLLKIQITFLSLVNAAAYFSLSLFFFTFHIAMRSFYTDCLQRIFRQALMSQKAIPFFINTMDFIFALIVFAVVYYSLILTHSNKHFSRMIYACSTLLGILAIVVYVVLAYSISQMAKIDSNLTSFLKYSVLIMLGLHLVPTILYTIMHKKFQLFVEMTFGAVSFIYYTPTYLIILNIYALCRMDDISWGTKGIDSETKSLSKVKQKWRRLKFVHVFKYLLWNTVLSCTLISVEYQFEARVIITLIIVFIVSSILVVKFVLGFIYSLKYKFKHRQVVVNQLPPSVRFMSGVNTRIRDALMKDNYKNIVKQNVKKLFKIPPPQDEQPRQ